MKGIIFNGCQIIARFLPASVSHLLVTYLRYVIPFIRLLDGNGELLSNVFLFGDKNKPWETEGLTEVLKRMTGRKLGFRMTNNLYRHTSIAIDRRHIRPESQQEMEESDEEEDIGGPHDIMAAHSKKISDNIYARVRNLTRSLTPEAINTFREVCDRTHNWLQMAPRDVRPIRKDELEGASIMTASQRGDKIEKVMVELFGMDWRWKSEGQRESVEITVSGVSPLFVILPTGGGKTLSFMVAVKMKRSGVTVIVTPLIALGRDLVRRFKEVKVDTILYSRTCQRRAKVVVVVTETASQEYFVEYLRDLQLEGVLDRVVYDEAHKLISDQSYRPYIMSSKDLRLRCQLMFITATCPPELVEEICEEMVVPIPHVIREEYYRPSFIYGVEICKKIEIRLREYLKQRVTKDKKCLVFCNYKSEVKRYAREYGARKYYSGQEGNQQELEEWNEGIMFATTALGAGVDVMGIEDVVHINVPYGLLEYAQESGRGGRSGEVVQCKVLIEERHYREWLEVPRESLSYDEAALRDFLTGEICRNRILTEYLNGKGKGKTCVEGKGMLCDICMNTREYRELKRKMEEIREERVGERKRRKQYDLQVELREEMVKVVDELWDYIQYGFNEIGNGCTICWIMEEDFRGHELKSCRSWEEVFPTMTVGKWRGSYLDLSLVKNSCWSCGLPGDKCEIYMTERRKCGRQDYILPTVVYFAMRRDVEYSDVVRTVLGREFMDLKELSRELTRKARVLEENGTVGFKVWVEIVKARGKKKNTG